MSWKFNPFTKKLDFTPVTATITDGDTENCPDGNSVYDALALKLTKSDNLSDVANAATAFGNIKQSATTSATGVVELATQAEVLAGTDTSRAVVPVDLWAKTAIDVNPKAFSQAVAMTYASSGSSGIAVADDDDIDFGTGNFTLRWRGALPDWTPGAVKNLLYKYQDSDYQWWLYLTAGDSIGLYLKGESTVVYNSTAVTTNTFVDGSTHEITAVIIRETAGSAGSVTYYVDGRSFGTPGTITAAAPKTLSNSGTLYISGAGSVRNASTNHIATLYNRALSAAEVKSLYENGVAEADEYGSQTPIYTSDFSAGTNSFTNYHSTVAGNIDGIGGENDCLRITVDATNDTHGTYRTIGDLTVGKKYRLSFKYYIPSGQSNVDGIQYFLNGYSSTLSTLDAWTTVSVDEEALQTTIQFNATSGGSRVFQDAGGDDVFYLKNVVATKLGAVLDLEPEGIQSDKWYDASTNALNATYPAAGSSFTRRWSWATLPAASNNAAASAVSVQVGGLYRTDADPSLIAVRTV